MLPKTIRRGLVIALGILGGLSSVGDLAAQDHPPSPKPAPWPSPITPRTKSIPSSDPTVIEPGALSMPDLRLTLSPRSPTEVPNALTVENAGTAPATRSSILRATVRLLDLDFREAREWASVLDALGIDLRGADLEDLCEPPFEDLEMHIEPLEPGESEEVSRRTAGWVGGGIGDVGRAAARPATRVPTHSYFRSLGVQLVCVYELRATVDANRAIAESNEGNNEIVHTFQRQVTLH